MKRFYLLLMTLSLSLFLKAQITQEEATTIVQDYIKQENIADNHWLYENQSISKNSNIKTIVGELNSPDFDSWLYFIDELPFANWSHNSRFVFVNTINGKISIQNVNFPPTNINEWKMLTDNPDIPKGEKFNLVEEEKSSILKSGLVPANCYAVIISGGMDSYNNWERYWNDCSAIYSTLVNIYGYLDSHIYVLTSDGTNSGNDRHFNDFSYGSSPLDLDGDGDNDTQFSATRANITSVFNTLSGILDTDDYLFIFSTDHGGQDSGDDVYINLWNETMNDDEFAVEVNKVNAGEINIVMEQCHSGGFIADLSDENRVIATACTAGEPSWAMPPNYTYNEFAYHWTAAVAGEDPNGNTIDADTDNNGYVSVQEAFDYAYTNDDYVNGVYISGYGTVYEHPQYNSQKYTLGENLTLLGKEICVSTDYIHDETINTDVTIEDCNIDIDNVTIQNNANVIIDAETNLTIQKDFEVKVGSTLEIK
jgi:hypothetical protein